MSNPTPPPTPGFYPAQHANGELRFWDGAQWRDEVPSPVGDSSGAAAFSNPYLPVAAAPTKPRRKKWPWIVGGAAAVLVIGAIASAGSGSDSGSTQAAAVGDAGNGTTKSDTTSTPVQVSVPNVVGSTISQAESELRSQGLDADSQGADGSQTISAQSPSAGSTVEKGTSVTLTASPAQDGSSASAAAPVGTKFDMQSTNRLDGSKSEYQEWIDSYNDNYVSTNEFEQPDANMKYVVLTVHVTATTAGITASSVGYDLALADTAGTVYDSTFVDGLTDLPSATLGAGQVAQGQVAFEVPNDFHGGIASFGQGSVFEKTN